MGQLKIVLSPSKTQNMKVNSHLERFYEAVLSSPMEGGGQNDGVIKLPHPKLIKKLRSLSKPKLGKALDIQDKLLEQTYSIYKDWETLEHNYAIGLYTGSVFKGMKIETYDHQQLKYLQEHVRILSALYGVLEPFDQIKPYRLDMNHSVLKETNEKLWKASVRTYFSEEDVIVNLASDEFSKVIQWPMINLVFKEQVSGKWVIKSTYAKIARGLMANYIITNQIQEVEMLKSFQEGGYAFSEALSSPSEWIFTREN